jgi:zinc transport system substrate-binding protein
MKASHFLLALALFATSTGCKRDPGADGAGKPSAKSGISNGRLQVHVANYPLAYFVERIGSTEVDVTFAAPPDEDPAFWQPSDKEIAAMQAADLVVMNGATYSKWAEKVSLPESKIVDTSASFKGQFIEIKESTTHSHGKSGEHSHAGTAFTTWIDFQQAIRQADAIREALQKHRSGQIELFALNFDQLKSDLLALDKEMTAAGEKFAGQPLVASHPVYQYFARRYKLNLREVHWEPEVVPDDAAMEELKKILATHPVKWMIWEGEPAKESVEKLKAIGVDSVVFDPCGNKPEKGNWHDVMKENIAAMKKAAGI